MSLSYEDALEKVKKLLKLSTSNNPNESATAAAMAQQIMDKYNISQLAINEANPSIEVKTDIVDTGANGEPVDSGGRLTQWRIFLITSLATANGCVSYINRRYRDKTSIFLIGERNSVQTINYLYKYFSSEIDRLANQNCSGTGRIYSNNYRIGAVTAINDRLKEQRFETIKQLKGEQNNNQTALAVIDKAVVRFENKINEAREFMNKNKNMGKNYQYSKTVGNYQARQHGYSDGRKINMSGKYALGE